MSSAINASAEKSLRGGDPLLTAFGSKGTKALVAKTTGPENNSDDDGNKIAVACELKNEEKNKNIHVCVWQYTCRVCLGGGSNFLIRDPIFPSRIQGTQRLLGEGRLLARKYLKTQNLFCYCVCVT